MVGLPRYVTRSRAYKVTFLGDKGEPLNGARQVLADLKRFCHVDRPTIKIAHGTGMIDPIASAVAEGRREVWLRIQAMLNLSETQVQLLQEDFND
jgi:hypothetical protein